MSVHMPAHSLRREMDAPRRRLSGGPSPGDGCRRCISRQRPFGRTGGPSRLPSTDTESGLRKRANSGLQCGSSQLKSRTPYGTRHCAEAAANTPIVVLSNDAFLIAVRGLDRAHLRTRGVVAMHTGSRHVACRHVGELAVSFFVVEWDRERRRSSAWLAL